jgi:hypothetical protein
MGEVDPSGGVASSANLLALAARVESEGRYNVAKLLRAAVGARAQREADEALAAAPRRRGTAGGAAGGGGRRSPRTRCWPR